MGWQADVVPGPSLGRLGRHRAARQRPTTTNENRECRIFGQLRTLESGLIRRATDESACTPDCVQSTIFARMSGFLFTDHAILVAIDVPVVLGIDAPDVRAVTVSLCLSASLETWIVRRRRRRWRRRRCRLRARRWLRGLGRRRRRRARGRGAGRSGGGRSGCGCTGCGRARRSDGSCDRRCWRLIRWPYERTHNASAAAAQHKAREHEQHKYLWHRSVEGAR